MAAVIPVGIDLGTTYSAVAYIDDEGSTRMAPALGNSPLMPSLLLFEEDGVRSGWEAWDKAVDQPDCVAEHAKRDMGMAAYRHTIHGAEYPPEVLQGLLLRRLQSVAANAVGDVFKAVITVPAYFDEQRRKAAADAAKMSGLEVLDIVNEPTAAALAFGERLGYLSPDGAPSDRLKLLVYDLGGGTFDVTVMDLTPDGVRTLAIEGDYELGGLHWEDRLIELATDRLSALGVSDPLSNEDRLRLRRAAQGTKHKLSDASSALLAVEVAGHRLELPVTRSEFETLTADLLDRSAFTTRQAMQSAGLVWRDIDHVLLVGGSTRMPAVRQMLEKMSERPVEHLVHPDEAVARGAAIYARYLMGLRGEGLPPQIQITDVNAHGLGIQGVNQETLRVENVVLIPRNTPLPHRVKRKFVTQKENQRSVQVRLLEGDSSLPDLCSELATAGIRHLPPGLPAGTEVEVTYAFESNGRLRVDAALPGFGKPAEIELERVHNLPDERVQKWRNVVCKDGGYHDFENALAELLASDSLEPDDAPEPDSPKSVRPSREDLTPAVDHGAPQAAATRLEQHANPARKRSIPTHQGVDFQPVAEAMPTPPSDLTATETDSHDPQSAAITPEDSVDGFSQQASLAVPRVIPRRRFKRRSPLTFWITLTGHVVSSVIGLALGYYLLARTRPDLNFLGLDLPGLPPVSSSIETERTPAP